MDSNLVVGGVGVLLIIGLLKFVLGGGNGDVDEATDAVKEVATSLRLKLKEWKERYAKKKHDDTVDGGLDDWLDDELGPKP